MPNIGTQGSARPYPPGGQGLQVLSGAGYWSTGRMAQGYQYGGLAPNQYSQYDNRAACGVGTYTLMNVAASTCYYYPVLLMAQVTLYEVSILGTINNGATLGSGTWGVLTMDPTTRKPATLISSGAATVQYGSFYALVPGAVSAGPGWLYLAFGFPAANTTAYLANANGHNAYVRTPYPPTVDTLAPIVGYYATGTSTPVSNPTVTALRADAGGAMVNVNVTAVSA